MTEKPAAIQKTSTHVTKDGAIPRMGMNIPTPASTKPPAAPTTTAKK